MAEYNISGGITSDGIILENNTMLNGGVQTVPDWQAVPRQIIYLDFDGELTKYRNEDLDLSIDNVQVEDSMLSRERIAGIIAALNTSFSVRNVLFTSERPKDTAYSTIFVGRTSAFDQYGHFAGLAESVDIGNQIKDDNAFVLLDASDSDSDIVSTIAHEAGHLLGTLDHGGDALDRYAGYTYYYYLTNYTFSGYLAEWIELKHYESSIHIDYSSYEGDAGDTYSCLGSYYDKANNTNIHLGGYLILFSGATANNTNIYSGGGLYVSSGGTANDTAVNSGGGFNVGCGGTANATMVNSSGEMMVLSGGTANSTTVNSGGTMLVGYNPYFVGGTANSTTVNLGGDLWVPSGGTATMILENGGYVYVADDAFATFVSNTLSRLVLSDTSATVHSSTTANYTTLNSNSDLWVFGGTMNSTTVNYGGWLRVSSGGTMNRTTVNSSGHLFISSGGTANSTTVNYGGSFYVSSGGTAMMTIENGGYVQVADDAFATFVPNTISGLVLSNVSATVHSGTTANYITLNDCGWLLVYGGKASETTVNSDGYLLVASGGTASDTTVVDSGQVWVFSGGTANSTTVESGYLEVDHSGYADNTTINSNGKFRVYSSGTANSTTVNDNGYLYVYSGGTAKRTIVNYWGRVFVLNDGSAYITRLNGGDLFISSGGVASNTVIYSGGIDLSGIANHTFIYGGGGIISKGGIANFTEIEGGRLLVFSGGTANYTTVNGGSMGVSSGGTATEILENGGYVSIEDGAFVTFASNTLSGLILSNTSATVHSGTTANSTTVNSSGYLYVYSSGMVNDSIISGGYLYVLSGGTVNDTIVSGGYLEVSSGGTANGTVVTRRAMSVYSGGTANSTTVDGGRMDVSGGTANCITVNSSGSLNVYSGGTANSITLLSNGSLSVNGGGTANSITVDSLGRLNVTLGGIVNNTSLSRGVFYLSSGGTANSTTVNSGGYMMALSGCTATEIIENGGYVYVADDAFATFVSHTLNGLDISDGSATVHSGTTANNTAINSGGGLEISSGGIANNTVVNSFAGLHVFSGGIANNTTVNSGGAISLGYDTYFVGGTANSTTVNSDGSLNVYSGGIANDITINSGGYLFLSSGGKITGKMTFGDGATVFLGKDFVLDFDLTQTSAGEDALVNNLSFIRGGAIFTLTVDADLIPGRYTYSLADGAENFGSTITVVNKAGRELGVLTLGETVRIGYNDYTLNLNEGALSVTIGAPDLTPGNLTGTSNELSWGATGAHAYVVELSTSEPGNALTWTTSSTAQDLYGLPGGTYQWRVKADANSYWADGAAIVSENALGAAKVLQSDGDDCDDLFFATPTDTWSRLYYAQHVGSLVEDGWTGTKEIVSANGKGRIQNLFFGSADPNVLCLTDGENGDAIFLDDMYTELPEEIEANTARLLQIHEIRAGAGDDIVDMTSQQFAYLGGGQTIRGGDGNDVIWANTGANRLFGDAGDDRIVGASGNDVIAGGIGDDSMHGGGGDDVFTFCDNWGKDTVQQLETGSVTLWFASGDESNWDAEKLTYTDGENSVTVVGVTAEQVTLKFGDDGSERFASLANMGAFDDATSRKTFEAVLA